MAKCAESDFCNFCPCLKSIFRLLECVSYVVKTSMVYIRADIRDVYMNKHFLFPPIKISGGNEQLDRYDMSWIHKEKPKPAL